MAERQLTNPSGGNSMSSVVADHRLFVGSDGHAVPHWRTVIQLQANAAIVAGDLVSFVVPTATAPLRVKQAVTGDVVQIKIGVALSAASAAGQVIQIVTEGFCFVNVAGGTAAFGNYGVPSATAGVIDPTATAIDAAVVAGTVLGTFLGAKNAANMAPFWFQKF